MSIPSSVIPVKEKSIPETGKDPIRIMIEIAENENLSDADKAALILYSQTRFKNRRLMAYLALYAVVTSLALLFIAAFIDGFSSCSAGESCVGILGSIKNSQTLFAWVEGFLTSIVAAYFGLSAWRPAS